MAVKPKSAHWQAAFRRRMRESGLKALTIWLPKEGIDRLVRYPEKERGEVITRALALLESQGEFTGNDATLTGERLTDESRDEGETREDTLTVAELSTRLERVEAILSTITSNSTGEAAGIIGEPIDKPTAEAVSGAIDAQTVEPEEAVALSDTPSPPVAEPTATPTVTTLPEPPVKLPLKCVAALIRQAKKLSAKGVSWKKIAAQWNAEGIPTHSGIGKWHGSTVAKLVRNE
jgi:Recombinase